VRLQGKRKGGRPEGGIGDTCKLTCGEYPGLNGGKGFPYSWRDASESQHSATKRRTPRPAGKGERERPEEESPASPVLHSWFTAEQRVYSKFTEKKGGAPPYTNNQREKFKGDKSIVVAFYRRRVRGHCRARQITLPLFREELKMGGDTFSLDLPFGSAL